MVMLHGDGQPSCPCCGVAAAGVIIVSLGTRYQSYCANVSRTYIINPNKAQEAQYNALLAAHEAACAALKDGQPAKASMEAAIRVRCMRCCNGCSVRCLGQYCCARKQECWSLENFRDRYLIDYVSGMNIRPCVTCIGCLFVSVMSDAPHTHTWVGRQPVTMSSGDGGCGAAAAACCFAGCWDLSRHYRTKANLSWWKS